MPYNGKSASRIPMTYPTANRTRSGRLPSMNKVMSA